MNFDVLPDGWAIAKVSDVISHDGIIADGDWVETKDQDPNGKVRLIQLADIGDGNFRNKSERFMTTENAIRMNCTFLETGDVLIARMPDPLGRACIFPGVSEKAVTVVDVCLIRLPDGSALQNKLLMYWINNPEIRNLIALQSTGTTRKRITRKKLEELKLPLPPLAEQHQIAAKLDEQLAQVDSIKTRLGVIPKILKRFRQSVLAAAVSGKLTEVWRTNNLASLDFESLVLKLSEERKLSGFKPFKELETIEQSNIPHDIPSNWKWVKLGQISLKITDGAHNTPKVFDNGFPYLMAKDLTGGKLDFSENRFISEYDHRELYNKCQPQAGDLLVVNIGAGTGNNVLINVDFEFSFKNMAIIKRPDFVVPNYLKYFFDARKEMIFQEQARGGAQPFLSLKLLNNIDFALPPKEEQIEIVHRVEQLFAYADQIEQRVKDAQARVNHLNQSILAKAFRGELTADWRAQNPDLISGENSAEALLNNIQLELSAENSKSKSIIVRMKTRDSMTPKKIIPVYEALRAAGNALSGQELLKSAGYPSDASTQQLERFFLDIRQQLELKTITRNRPENSDQDWFEVIVSEG